MNIFAYDTETTGLVAQFDRPLQFAACHYDDELTLLKEINLRGRLPRYLLPSPDALLTTGRSISQVQSAPLSHHEFITNIAQVITASSPSIMMTFNGIRYDDEILRHSFYANLLSPYLTQLNGNTRFDVLVAARSVEACAPGSLTVPRKAHGKRSFRLEDLAPANGFGEHEAHDALGDVKATVHLATVMMQKAPGVWSRIAALRDKATVNRMISTGEPLVHVDWDHFGDGPVFRAIMPIVVDERNGNEWLCVDLGADLQHLRSLDATSIEVALHRTDGEVPIHRIKVNAMPVLFTLTDSMALRLPVVVEAHAGEEIRRDVAFVARLREAASIRRARFAQPIDVWGQLYDGGFFPAPKDKPVIGRFHASTPNEKWELISDMSDPRARQIARWLVGSEWPDVLGQSDRRSIEEEFREHLMKDEAKWTTVPSALARIDELMAGATERGALILEEYRGYLMGFKARG